MTKTTHPAPSFLFRRSLRDLRSMFAMTAIRLQRELAETARVQKLSFLLKVCQNNLPLANSESRTSVGHLNKVDSQIVSNMLRRMYDLVEVVGESLTTTAGNSASHVRVDSVHLLLGTCGWALHPHPLADHRILSHKEGWRHVHRDTSTRISLALGLLVEEKNLSRSHKKESKKKAL